MCEFKMLKSLLVGVAALAMVACGEEAPKNSEPELMLPLKLSEDFSLSLQGEMVQNIFAFGQWLKQKDARSVIIASYTDEDTKENAETEESIPNLCAEMVRSLLLTQGVPENRMKTVVVKYEDEADGEALLNAMDEGDYSCLVKVKVEKQ
ncbi:MAG: hypothetical protein IKN71_04355 [Alphaproteobacteria bacterium]|nr:hypothetical protein [Alphaproteobacteria bacterium]